MRIRQELARVDDLKRRLEALLQTPIAPGSPAAADDGLPNARFVGMRAGQTLGSAIDHLNTWRLLIDPPREATSSPSAGTVPILAHVTLLRGAIEGAMMCRWLAEPRASPRNRVARGYAAQRDDYCERDLYERSRSGDGLRPPSFRNKTAKDRIAELDKWRDEAGIPSVGLADVTSLARKYGCERWFRLASAAAHGKEWALVAADINAATIERSAPGVLGSVFSASDDIARDLTIVAVQLTAAAMDDLEAYRAPRSPGRRARNR